MGGKANLNRICLFPALVLIFMFVVGWRRPFFIGSRRFLETKVSNWADANESTVTSIVGIAESTMPLWSNPALYQFVVYVGGSSQRSGDVLQPNEVLDCPMTIMTSGSKDTAFDLYEKLHQNRMAYAERQKYCYVHFSCIEIDKCGQPHFWRYVGFWRLVTTHLMDPSNSFVLIMDMDTMFTNFDKRMETTMDMVSNQMGDPVLTQPYSVIPPSIFSLTPRSRDGPSCKLAIKAPVPEIKQPSPPQVILSADAMCSHHYYPINSGVMLWKGSVDSLLLAYTVITSLSVRAELVKRNRFAAGMLKDQPILLYALEEKFKVDLTIVKCICLAASKSDALFKEDSYLYRTDNARVVVLAPRVINAFIRKGYKDVPSYVWHAGDFVGHLTGMTDKERVTVLEEVCAKLEDPCVCPWRSSCASVEPLDYIK